MCFGSDKIGKIQFFHFLVEIARKLSLLWLRPVWGPKAQCISLLLEQSDQAFVAYRSSNRLIEGALKWLGWLCIRNPFLAILQYFRDQILTSQVEFYLLRPSNWWQMMSTWLSWREVFVDLVINLLEHFLKNPSFRTFWHFFDYIL